MDTRAPSAESFAESLPKIDALIASQSKHVSYLQERLLSGDRPDAIFASLATHSQVLANLHDLKARLCRDLAGSSD